MSTIVWWSGVSVWVCIAVVCAFFIYEALRSVIASASWHTWAIKEIMRRGVKVPWMKLPKSFCVMWWRLVGHRLGSDKWTTSNGAEWRAICDWNLGSSVSQDRAEP